MTAPTIDTIRVEIEKLASARPDVLELLRRDPDLLARLTNAVTAMKATTGESTPQ